MLCANTVHAHKPRGQKAATQPYRGVLQNEDAIEVPDEKLAA